MGDICEICKKNPAKIQIDGKHQYCLDCYNSMTLDNMGIEDTFTYAKTVSVIEPGGCMHVFEIEHVVLGSIVSWDAYEKGGDYHFRLISNTSGNGAEAAQKLFRKIVEGVCCKTIEECRSNGGTTYQIKSKGNIRISENEEGEYETVFEVDGKKYTSEELAELFKGYAGFNIQFQIHDESDPILGEGEYLVPVKVTEQELLHEIDTALAVTTDKYGFLSYKDVPVFDEFFYKVIDKLQILYDAMEVDKALQIGRAIAKRLREVEHDDDWFPYGDIQLICEVVDPYGDDEELKGYLEGDM